MKVRDNPDVLYHWEQMQLRAQDWHSSPGGCPKSGIINDIKKKWKYEVIDVLEVSKLHWDGEEDWSMDDILYRDEIFFDVANKDGIDELVGYLFQASIDGYSIRYVSGDPNALYLQRTKTGDTNIDEDVLEAIVEALDEMGFKRSQDDDS